MEKAAPFLEVDGDPYPAVIDGRVVWILDGYTTSDSYPYSEQMELGEAATDALTGTGTTGGRRHGHPHVRVPAPDLGHHGALAARRAHDAVRLELAVGAHHGVGGDAEVAREGPDGGEAGAGGQLAGGDEVCDPRPDLLEGRDGRAEVNLDRGLSHGPPPPVCRSAGRRRRHAASGGHGRA